MPTAAVTTARVVTTPRAFEDRATPRAAASSTGLAWALLLAALGMAAVAGALQLATLSAPVAELYGFRGFAILYALANATVGALIVRREPRNAVGWILAAAGVVSGLVAVANEYAVFTLLARPGALPAGVWAGWVASWVWIPLVVLGGTVFALFPSGALPSRRWRLLLVALVAAGAVALAAHLFVPGRLAQFEALESPAAVPGLSDIAAVLWQPALVVTALLTLATAGALVHRYRGEAHEEQRQIRLVVTAVAVFAVLFVLDVIFRGARPLEIIVVLAGLAIPIAVGIAILRYRLYQIDQFIGQAIVYGTLTAILAGAYTASVTLFQRLFVVVSGESSDAAIVATTLLLASAFLPVRNWLQALVDRTFRSPDAARGLRAYVGEVRAVLRVFDRERLVEGLLAEAVAATHAGSGVAQVVRDGELRVVRTVGSWRGEECVSLEFRRSDELLGRVTLGPRRDGRPYARRSCEALQAAGEAVAPALALTV